MKIIEARGEEAIEMIADLIDPIADIVSDMEIVKCIETDQKLKAVKFAMKRHTRAVLEMLAICEGVPIDDYSPSLLEIPAKLMEVINHPDVSRLFTMQAQTEAPSFGLVTEITEGAEN